MTIAFDNASVLPQPVKWELDCMSVISSVLGLLGVIQSFSLLYLGDTLHHLDHPQVQNHDVSTTCSRWSSHVIRDSHPGSVMEATLSKSQTLLCNCSDSDRRHVPVQSGLARAVTSLENHRFCLGLQPDLDQFAKLRGQQHV
jgi:hypothetical protein